MYSLCWEVNKEMPGRYRTGPTGPQPNERVIHLAKRLADVERLKSEGQLVAARKECEALLRDSPGYVGALSTHGSICLKLKDFDRAYASLVRANDLYPDDCMILTALARAKTHLAMKESAVRDLQAALALVPGNLAALNSLAELYMLGGELDKVERVLRDIVSQDLGNPESKVRLARFLIYSGKFEESRALLRGLIKAGYISPKVLQTISFFPEDPGLVNIVSATDHIMGRSKDEQANIFSVRATGMHWAGRHAEAWDLYCRSNAIRWNHQGSAWREQRISRQYILRRNESMPVAANVQAQVGSGPRPLFVLGASRSGKSIIERLLSAIPTVFCGYENSIHYDVLRRVVDGARCTNVANLIDMPSELGATYAAQFSMVLRQRAPDAGTFISTGPDPIGDALMLNRYVPGCRFVFLKRTRRDNAFRIFMFDYHEVATHMTCAADLGAIKEYLDWYEALIDICAARMPEQCIVLNYEDVVEDPAAAVAQILDLCGGGAVPDQLPDIGDDRDVSAPYAHWLDPALGL